MSIFRKLSTIAVRHSATREALGDLARATVEAGQVAGVTLGAVAVEVGGGLAANVVEAVVGKLQDHFRDHSERLPDALRAANERAWRTLEIALAGPSFWSLAPTEDQKLAAQIRGYLDRALPCEDAFRQGCLHELRQAREKHLLAPGVHLDLGDLASEAAAFARYDDPEALHGRESELIQQVAGELNRLGYKNLGRLLNVRPERGQGLLAIAAQYYFRRAVESDDVLSRGLAWARLVRLDEKLEQGFALLASIQDRHSQKLDDLLAGLGRVEATTSATHDVILEMAEKVQSLTVAVQLHRHDLEPRHSISYRDEAERRAIESLKRKYRELSDEQRQRHPGLALDLSRLEMVAGEFEEALADARRAADLQPDDRSRAESHHAAFRAALELRQWDEALVSIREAIRLDPDRYAPFPLHSHELIGVLGAGAFGVAYLARSRRFNRTVVFKSFQADGLDLDVSTLFREAEILNDLRHPNIIRLHDADCADPARNLRPYLMLEHFDGLSLEEHILRHGPLSPDDLLEVARPVAEALRVAHEAGILHRDVKPSNILVRRTPSGWESRVIDFGLSLRPSRRRRASAAQSVDGRRSLMGRAGTFDYASPEQLDPARFHLVGPHSDVFSFGRTCLFALFQTVHPRSQCRQALPTPWPSLLDDCLDPQIETRLPDFNSVLACLASNGVSPPSSPQPEPRSMVTAKSYLDSGDAHLECAEYDQAIAEYTRAVELAPKEAIGYRKRGSAYRSNGEYDLAIADYTRVIELDPSDTIAYNNRGLAYSENKSYEMAINDFSRAIELNPNEFYLYINRYDAYLANGAYERAIADLSSADARCPASASSSISPWRKPLPAAVLRSLARERENELERWKIPGS